MTSSPNSRLGFNKHDNENYTVNHNTARQLQYTTNLQYYYNQLNIIKLNTAQISLPYL